ncbi:TldD/PmbA family protein, partial [archaeon]|nr:TldD/PmbA family protein [archaeon]
IEMHFLNSEGSDIYSGVPRVVAQADLIAKKDENLIGYRVRVGGTSGFEIFDSNDPVEKGVCAAKSAVRILSAEKSPSGRFPVIANPDLTGVFAHEALGHAAEADSVISGESILEKRIGEKVASELVTIYDDPTMENGFGSFPYDDEGLKGSKKILIENGVLKNFILNRETAFKLGMNPNGGARAESFAVRPLVRMSNTMIEKGNYSFDELIEDIKYGVYAKGTRGGQVDTAKGSFQFSAQEAWLIEHGEVTKPLKDLSLSGLTLETLKNIDAVAKDVRFGEPGFCGKGQLVPVGDGGPHIRIKEVLIGGG